MASVGVQKCFKVSVNEIDTLIGSKQKNLNLMGNHFCATFFILETMISGWNMTFLRYYPSNFSIIYAILSSFYGIHILLNGNFYQLQHNIQYINILMAILQCIILMDSIKLMIIIAINTIGLMLFLIYVMCNSNDCKIFGNGINEIFVNYAISMDNINFRHQVNHLILIYVHFYFYMSRNGAQVENSYASDDLNLDLDGLCIDYYNVANANWIILYKCLHLYILFCVNNYHLNVCGHSISISQTGGIIIQYVGLFCLIRIVLVIIIVLLVVYSSINKFKGSDNFDMVNSYCIVKYISCNVLYKNWNYPTNCNYLSLIIVFANTIVVIFNILDNALKLLIETLKNFKKDSMYTTIYNYMYNTMQFVSVIIVIYVTSTNTKNILFNFQT